MLVLGRESRNHPSGQAHRLVINQMKSFFLPSIIYFYHMSRGGAFTHFGTQGSYRKTVVKDAGPHKSTELFFFFDQKFQAGGSGKDDLDEQVRP
jgi:hypothetical protein